MASMASRIRVEKVRIEGYLSYSAEIQGYLHARQPESRQSRKTAAGNGKTVASEPAQPRTGMVGLAFVVLLVRSRRGSEQQFAITRVIEAGGHFLQRLGFDLANTLASQAKQLANFF